MCKESFWWDGFEIIPPRPKLGLLSNYANRHRDESSEGSSEECTEEESSSSSSCSGGSDEEASAESNPVPVQVVVIRFFVIDYNNYFRKRKRGSSKNGRNQNCGNTTFQRVLIKIFKELMKKAF